MRANVWKELENYFLILLGTALMAIAIQWIFADHRRVYWSYHYHTKSYGSASAGRNSSVADEYCAEYSDISVFLYPVWKKIYRENGLCNHFAFGVALSDTGDRYVRG